MRVPITKTAMQPDGSLLVAGPCTNPDRDLEGQRVDGDWAARKVTQFLEDFGAPIRVEHDYDRPPAGKGLDVSFDYDKVPYLRARVAQKDAIQDVLDGKLKDFSLGMCDVPLYPDPDAPNGRIGDPSTDEGYVAEISLVGIGAAQGGKGCHFNIVKRANKSAPIETPGLAEDGFVKALRKEAKRVSKRDMDPDVGGGVDRDKLPPKAFVFPDTRTFPVVTPGDVSDAVSSWGRYKGSESFESFKKRLTALARRKGDAFVAELPASWSDKPKKEKSTMAKQAATKTATDATKAADDTVTKAAIPEGRIACGSCEGGKIKGELDCPKCGGKGHVAAKKSKKAAVTKDDDSDVSDALDEASDSSGETSDAIGDAQQAQAADEAGEDKKAKKAAKKAAKLAAAAKGEGSEAVSTPAQDGKVKPGKKPLATGDMAAKAADDGDGGKKPPFEGAAKPFGKEKGKAKKSAEVPYLAVRAHDLVCPAYANKAVKSAYGDVTPAQIDPEFFQKHLASLAGSRKAAPGSIAEASQAFNASVGLVNLAPKSFGEMRRAAHKAWLDANPDMPNLKPGLIDPNTLRRGFLASANSEVAHTTTVPSPDLHPTLTPPDNSRVSPNSLGDGGHSVAKSARTFYTTSSKDEHAGMAGTIHDWLSDAFPGCCPMVDGPDPSAPAAVVTDSGSAADQVGAGADNTVGAVIDISRANKAAKKAQQETRALRKQVTSLKRTVKSMAAAPDPRAAAVRSHAFARRNGTDPSHAETLAKAKEAAAAIRSRDSALASEGLSELRELRDAGKISARQFGAFATAD